MKKIGKSDVIGQQGMSLIEGIVLSMGFMFYPTGGVEAGIDGFIELRDAETGEVGNLLLQVQGKATERERLQGETEETFEFPCADADIEYWTKGTAPVLLIVVALKTRKAYWKSLKQWFSDPERRKSRKVAFNKAKDEFTRESKAALVSVATAVGPGASGPSVKKSEQILVNLLEVRFAPRVFWAPTSHGTDKSFGGALGEIVKPSRGEWIVRSKSVLSFHPLDEFPWKKLCDWEAMEEFDTTEWANSDDEDRQRDFVALLNRAIGEFVRPDLYRDRDSRVFFFRKPKDRDSLNYAYRSLQNTTTRRVVGPYGKKKSDPKKFAYWRHSAFLHRFVRLAGKWYAEITPTYHFTYNGQDADAYAGERLKKIKEIENNAAVMGQFVMWRDFLTTHGAEDLLTKTYPYLSFSAVDALELDVGVPDDLWKSQETDPSSPLFEYALAGETVENLT